MGTYSGHAGSRPTAIYLIRNGWGSGLDLRGVDLSGADLSGADLTNADLSGADLSDVDLSIADLTNADLSGADLRNADIDYSCWPLHCGSFDVRVDANIFDQLVYHICRLKCDERADVQKQLAIVANNSALRKRHSLSVV